MKSCIAMFVIALGVIGISFFSKAEAEPVPQKKEQSELVALAPNEKTPVDPLAEKVAIAKKKAIEYLKKQQSPGGSWEEDNLVMISQHGGLSAIVALSLLEDGVPVEDSKIDLCLRFLRTIKLKSTYTVSLVTQVFCKANLKQDSELIQEYVTWLEDAASRNKGKLTGWTYVKDSGNRSDGSNSRYAIAALYAADRAGFKVKNKELWKEIQAMYLAAQTKDGGWGYTNHPQTSSTSTMTGSGIICLKMAQKAGADSKEEDKTAIEKGLTWLGQNFKNQQPHTFYHLDVLCSMGRLLESRRIGDKEKPIDWYREGVEWLLANQKEDGSFSNKGGPESPKLATAFALRFLSTQVK